jgi:hypothetical protein
MPTLNKKIFFSFHVFHNLITEEDYDQTNIAQRQKRFVAPSFKQVIIFMLRSLFGEALNMQNI